MVKISDYNVMIKDRNFKRAYAEWRDYKYAVAQEHRMHYIGKDHPHILQAYDVLHDDDERKSYLIMECPKDAITLSEYLKMHSAAVQSQERHRSWRVNSRLRETFSKEITRQIVSAVGKLKILRFKLRLRMPPRSSYRPQRNQHGQHLCVSQ